MSETFLRRILCCIYPAVILLVAIPLRAQNASAAPPTLQEQLEAQYPLATITAKGGCSVSNSDTAAALVIQKAGVVAVTASSFAPRCESNYKEGKLEPPKAVCTGLTGKTKSVLGTIAGLGGRIPDTSRIPEREIFKLEKGDSVYPTKFEVAEDRGEVRLAIGYCSGEGNQAAAYKGEVVFHFKKDILKNGNVAQIEDTIGEVFSQSSSDDTVGGSAPQSQDNPTQDEPSDGTAVAGQILTHVLQGDIQYLQARFAMNANTNFVNTISSRLSGLNHCSENIEVHKVTWRTTPPGYVALGNCDEGRPRLWMILDEQGKVSRIGTGSIISGSSSEQVKQKARDLVALLVHGNFAEFRTYLSPQMQSRDVSPWFNELNHVIRLSGDFESMGDVQLDLYSDVAVVTCAYQKWQINYEIAFDSSLRVINFFVQPAIYSRHIPQEFQDIR